MIPHPVEIIACDGCALRGQLWPGETARVLLLHDVGGDEDLDRWRPLLPHLLAERLSVLAVDLRGHGASDGEWQGACAVDDVAAIVRSARGRSGDPVVIVAAGRSAVDGLWAAESERIDGVVAISATSAAPRPDDSNAGSGADLPRAPGIPKLFLVGAEDAAARQITANLHAASIGWALVVTLPTAEHGTDLLTGSVAGHVREQILGFVRESRFLARPASKGTAPPPHPAEAFVRQLGITAKGAKE